eukprot:2403846-Pleurochrysis_carterae.AAC.6
MSLHVNDVLDAHNPVPHESLKRKAQARLRLPPRRTWRISGVCEDAMISTGFIAHDNGPKSIRSKLQTKAMILHVLNSEGLD